MENKHQQGTSAKLLRTIENSSDLSSTDETSIQSKNIGELSNFGSLTKAVHWRKQIIASTKPRNQMNEPLFRSKYI